MTTPSKMTKSFYAATTGKEAITNHFTPVPTKGSNRMGKTPAKSAKGKPNPTPITPHADANANLFDLLSDEDDDDGAINLTYDATDSDTDKETTTPSKKEAEAFARREARRKARKQLRKERKAKKAGKGRKKTKDTLLDEEEKAATTDDNEEFNFRDKWDGDDENTGEQEEANGSDSDDSGLFEPSPLAAPASCDIATAPQHVCG